MSKKFIPLLIAIFLTININVLMVKATPQPQTHLTYSTNNATWLHWDQNSHASSRVEYAHKGDWYSLDCWTYGTSFEGDRIWYKAVPLGMWNYAWIAGYRMNTGADPNPYILKC